MFHRLRNAEKKLRNTDQGNGDRREQHAVQRGRGSSQPDVLSLRMNRVRLQLGAFDPEPNLGDQFVVFNAIVRQQ